MIKGEDAEEGKGDGFKLLCCWVVAIYGQPVLLCCLQKGFLLGLILEFRLVWDKCPKAFIVIDDMRFFSKIFAKWQDGFQARYLNLGLFIFLMMMCRLGHPEELRFPGHHVSA